MFGWHESHESYEQVHSGERQHEASLSHEVLAGGAAFAAFAAFEKHQRSQGKAVSHAFAKEALAGLAAAEVDKLIETKGLDYIDRERAKRHAEQGVQRMYDEQYGGNDQYDPYQGAHSRMERYLD
ncbi:putative CipC-like antibiotic response protein [Pyronema omphalodes]|nr:putative CipC-like antibiotic response protein [Pyronema omphalodes]